MLHTAIGPIFLNADYIARAVVYAIKQPQNVVMSEMWVNSPKGFLSKRYVERGQVLVLQEAPGSIE